MKNSNARALSVSVAAATMAAFMSVAAPASANSNCPDGAGWTKVDGINSTTADFQALIANAGEALDQGEVLHICLKSGDHALVFDVLQPGDVLSVLSPFVNQNDQLQDLSHVAWMIEAQPDLPDEPEEPNQPEEPNDKDVAGKEVEKGPAPMAPVLPNTGAPENAIGAAGLLMALAGAWMLRRGRRLA